MDFVNSVEPECICIFSCVRCVCLYVWIRALLDGLHKVTPQLHKKKITAFVQLQAIKDVWHLTTSTSEKVKTFASCLQFPLHHLIKICLYEGVNRQVSFEILQVNMSFCICEVQTKVNLYWSQQQWQRRNYTHSIFCEFIDLVISQNVLHI